MKIVTYEEAIASGRPFRSRRHPLNGPAAKTGHIWRIADGGQTVPRLGYGPCHPSSMRCVDCGESLAFYFFLGNNEFIIQRTDEELESDAQDILNSLGIKVEETAV